ncbi:seed biotin-containing protein SBP65-like [Juglans microcarpa x Juglans regia]|uniref:seed biotin-containing protein SBP65-like n=1 Tax=Juglans microcarpa x Juglans regia TaxID=2249226 RepID=UPI001B7F7218|nr:seed biotin-containing protein SBP65-like [Juglans microcarpa x Juglans regia]
MASKQTHRENSTGEKDRVPTLTSHFESLADKVKDQEREETENQREKHTDQTRGKGSYVVGKFENVEDQNDVGKAKGGEGEGTDIGEGRKEGKEVSEGQERKEQPSLEDISKLRAKAQQNSLDTLRAAEERYEKAKESVSQGVGAATVYTKEKAAQTKDTVLDKGRAVKDSAAEKGAQAKETVTSTAKTAADYTASTAEKAKDYALQKAVEAKEVVVRAGETTVHNVEEKAEDLKDRTAVAGWTAAHYSCEKAVEGTKAAARAVKETAEYAGHKAAEIASKPLSAAKDVAVGTGESAKEYTARKKEETERVLKAKRSAENQGDNMEEESKVQQTKTKEVEEEGKPSESVMQESFQRMQENGRGNRGGILGAIAETIAEIAQQTKELIIGQHKT